MELSRQQLSKRNKFVVERVSELTAEATDTKIIGDLLRRKEETAPVGDLLQKEKNREENINKLAKLLADTENLEEELRETSDMLRKGRSNFKIEIKDQYEGTPLEELSKAIKERVVSMEEEFSILKMSLLEKSKTDKLRYIEERKEQRLSQKDLKRILEEKKQHQRREQGNTSKRRTCHRCSEAHAGT